MDDKCGESALAPLAERRRRFLTMSCLSVGKVVDILAYVLTDRVDGLPASLGGSLT